VNDWVWVGIDVVITGLNVATMVHNGKSIRRSRAKLKELGLELKGQGQFLHHGVMDKRHTCKLPGRRGRKLDDVWRCFCGQSWIWADQFYPSGYHFTSPRWDRLSVHDNRKPVPIVLPPAEIAKLAADGKIVVDKLLVDKPDAARP
jgi:hypothetical protein